MDTIRPRFVVLPGGKSQETVEGPITRLGLRDRFPQLRTGHWFWIVAAKALLLTSVLYLLFG